MSAPRIGLIGARRVRQGLGPFVARDLRAAGAEVACFSVTRESSIAPALAEIERFAGVAPRGYADARAMLDAEALDAVAILSPAETHAGHLAEAAARGLPTLCEKPLVWGEGDLAAEAARLVDAFDARGLLLVENCQWPCTLPAFASLYPGSLEAPPERFFMELQPASHGRTALGDSLSHPLSLLQALLPGERPEARDVAFSTHADPGGDEVLSLRFRYESDGRACDVRVELRFAERLPRRASFAVDDHLARRVVDPETYRLSFRSPDDRTVPLPDPLTVLVADFVARLQRPDEAERHARTRDIRQRMRLLAELADAHDHQEAP